MAFVKYKGLAHFRELLKDDFKKMGVEGQKALTFARHEVTEVGDDVAEALTKFLGDEFDKVKGDAAQATKSSTTTSSASVTPTRNSSIAGS
jgi:hypothetical protein